MSKTQNSLDSKKAYIIQIFVKNYLSVYTLQIICQQSFVTFELTCVLPLCLWTGFQRITLFGVSSGWLTACPDSLRRLLLTIQLAILSFLHVFVCAYVYIRLTPGKPSSIIMQHNIHFTFCIVQRKEILLQKNNPVKWFIVGWKSLHFIMIFEIFELGKGLIIWVA